MALMRDRLGVFSGFGESKYEIQSHILVPYHQSRMPLQGAFLVVSHDDFLGRPCGILGRVTRAIPIGDLMTTTGEDYLVDLVRLGYEVPEEVKSGRLRYRISLRLLGQLTTGEEGRIEYTPAIRQMPHVGAQVGFPSEEVTQFIARGCPDVGADPGPVIGHLAIGDLAFDGTDRARRRSVPVHFRMDSLVGRRTAVFARAGMGKSNFTKVLLTRLYQGGDGNIPGTLVIDPEGEYAFSNASEPGLLDVHGLKDRIVVFTERSDLADRYRTSILGDCTVNFADLDPLEVVNNVLPAEKQNMVFANHLRSLTQEQWKKLIQALDFGRYRTSQTEIAKIIGKKVATDGADVVIGAIVNNLVPAMDRLHSSKSVLVKLVLDSLRAGRIVILDVSMLAGQDAKLLAAWILRTVFANNQEAYTSARHATGSPAAQRKALIPCLAVFEEAQFYLGDERLREDSPFVRWFKEGRKFSLGSVLVTQQPGAIGPELISQCDNFFVFHLLSRIDLDALAAANLHYGGDIANSIGHEPIPGNCFLWSGRGLSFVTCARIIHFGKLAEESDRRRVPFAEVPSAVPAPAGEVFLAVNDISLGSPSVDSFLVAALKSIIEQNDRVFLFDVGTLRGVPDEKEECFSVVSDYLIPPLRAIIDRQNASLRNAGEMPELALPNAEALANLVSAQRLGPASCLLWDTKGKQHLVFFRSSFDLARRPPPKGKAVLDGP